MSLYEEIKKQLDIVEVISEYIPLKKVGNSYASNCPFHPDRTPSFFVSPSLQIWKCFGYGKGGDVIKFVAEYENLTYHEAALYLVEKYNLKVSSQFLKKLKKENNPYIHALSRIENFYYEELIKNKTAKRYLIKERKLPTFILEDFGIGFAGDGFQSVIYAKKENIFDHLLELKHFYRTSYGNFRDIFYERIIFPIRNTQGKTIAFGGRIIQNSTQEPKYKNSPNNIIFQKEKVLFGLDKALTAIREKKRGIITEGYIDVLRLHSIGFRETVAPLGTSLTSSQAYLLKKLTEKVYLFFDGDASGRNATLRNAKILLQFGLNVYVVELENPNEDPDSFALREGTKGVNTLIQKAKPILTLLIEKIKLASSLEMREKALKLFKEMVLSIPDEIKRELWIKELFDRTGIKISKRKNFFITHYNESQTNKEIFIENPTEREFLKGLLFLSPSGINLEELKLSKEARELAEKILKGVDKAQLPSWLFEDMDIPSLKKRFELALLKLSIEKHIKWEIFKELVALEKKISEGKATREDIFRYHTLLGEVNKKVYLHFAKTFREIKNHTP